jgi:signal transduction histidine kinase
MRYPHYSLRTALFIFVLLPLLALVAVAGAYSLNSLERQIEARMQEDIELIARAIRLPLSHAMEQGSADSLTQTLRSAFRIGRVYGAYVYDAAGERIAASGPRSSSTGSRKAAQLASAGDRQGEYEQVDGEEVFSYFVPLTDSGGRINGLLQVARHGSDFRDYIMQVRQQALWLLLVAGVLLATVILYGHHRAIGSHFRNLLNGMARVGAGDRNHRVPVQGPREMYELSREMNAMLDSLSRQEQVLAQQRADQVALEQRLRQSEKMAAIGQLAAGVAHELGTPLNVVDGKAQRALRAPGLPAQVASALQEIRREVRRTSDIVRQLMDFGRGNPLRRTREHADHLLREACAQLGETVSRRDIQLNIDASGEGPRVWVDRVRIEQALTNLVRNALQAASRQVCIGWFETPGAVGFLVEDDGPGVQADRRDRIFEPFYTTKPVNEGAGLGLAVAHAAVRDHGGTIEVERSPLGGARFRLVLSPQSGDEELSCPAP